MQQHGFAVDQPEPGEEPGPVVPAEPDEKVQIMERVLRAFMRATGVNENTFRKRLGAQASLFLDEMLPELEGGGVFQEVSFRGSGIQKRYKLGTSFDRLANAIEECRGDYVRFVEIVSE